MSTEKYLLESAGGHIDGSEGVTKLVLLNMLAEELGYGVYGLHKKEGKQKELTIVCYSDGTAIVDINKHQVAYDCSNMQYEVNRVSNNTMEINVDVFEATVVETDV